MTRSLLFDAFQTRVGMRVEERLSAHGGTVLEQFVLGVDGIAL